MEMKVWSCEFNGQTIGSPTEEDKTYYDKVSLYDIRRQLELWDLNGHFSIDKVLGLVSAGLLMLRERDVDAYYFFIARREDDGEQIVINNPFKLDKLGDGRGYIAEVAIETSMTGNYKSDDGTTGIWILNRTRGNGKRAYWDMIYTDNLEDFVDGFKKMCRAFGVDYLDYIHGNPMESEGSIIEGYFNRTKPEKYS